MPIKRNIYKMETNPVVTSVGNSWVVCRSKSHPGRIYYFNTFTGEAAWNLSEVEKEKAKTATKIIEKSGVNMDGCPEPKDPPQDYPSRHLPCNKQVQQVHNCQNSGTTKICNKTISDDAVLFSLCHRVHCCNHPNSLCHKGLISPISSNFNANKWNGPATQQVLLSSTISPLVNQPQCNIDVDYKKFVINDLLYVQKTSLPMHERFEKYTNDFHSSISIRARIKKFAKYLKQGVVQRNNLGLRNNLYDLPYAKSCANINNPANYQRQIHNDSRLLGGQYFDISENTNTIGCDQGDKSNLHNQQEANKDTVSAKKLNMSRLRNDAKRLFDKNTWCIISDTNTYLYHHGFMKILLDFDEECRLLVLDNVVEDIRNASRSEDVPTMNLGRRAISFISSNIRAGTAVIDRDDTVANNTGMTYILHCCRKYLREGYHILFLCSDTEVYNSEKGHGFPIYTVDELKSLLQCGTAEERKTSHQTPELRITVRINEDENAEDIRKVSKSFNIGIQTNDSELDTNTPKERVGVGVQATVEVGTQTPIDFVKSDQTICHKCKSQTTLNSATPEKQDTGAVVKKNDIKLNRNLYNQNSKKQDADKKHFQWRRKRPVGRAENTNSSPDEEITSKKDLSDDAKTLNTAKKPKLENQSDSVPTGSDMDATKSGRNNCADNVVLEEIATSGVVSNETSNLDSESSSETSEPIVVIDIRSENYKNFLFEITGEAMQENLKTRCDEWVSRFFQIMEEVLKQLLHKDPTPSSSLSPPSTLREVAQCIKMRYAADVDIFDAADKLSGILLDCSDQRGNIDIHMSPDQYMKLYSCGAYLIDSLKSANDNSEDLETAAESLAKLLKDIQNPNGDNDMSQVVALDEGTATKTNEEAELNEAVDIPDSAIILQQQLNKKASIPRKYNLRSQWKRTFQNDLLIPSCPDTKVRFFRDEDTESTFFSSLNLKKNYENDRAKATDAALAIASRRTSAEENDSNSCDDSLASDKPQATGTLPNEPKIIRNFTKHKDYENRVKKMSPDQTVFEESNKSNVPQIDYLNNEIDNNDENENDEATMMGNNDENENHGVTSETSDEDSDDDSDTDSPSGNNPLRAFMGKVLREIREIFLVMYAFCEESQKRLAAPDAERDTEIIINKAKETHSAIVKLYDALQSISNRDVKETEQNISNFLKSEQVNDFNINEQDLQEYRIIIERCLHQANVIRDTVECIMRQEC